MVCAFCSFPRTTLHTILILAHWLSLPPFLPMALGSPLRLVWCVYVCVLTCVCVWRSGWLARWGEVEAGGCDWRDPSQEGHTVASIFATLTVSSASLVGHWTITAGHSGSLAWHGHFHTMCYPHGFHFISRSRWWELSREAAAMIECHGWTYSECCCRPLSPSGVELYHKLSTIFILG